MAGHGRYSHEHRFPLESDASLLRPSEIMVSRANPEKSARILGWQATYRMKDVARMMVEDGRIIYG